MINDDNMPPLKGLLDIDNHPIIGLQTPNTCGILMTKSELSKIAYSTSLHLLLDPNWTPPLIVPCSVLLIIRFAQTTHINVFNKA